MAVSKASFNRPAVATAPTLVGLDEANDLRDAIHHRIETRAYRRFVECGCQHGHDQQHWFEAETETLKRGFALRNSAGWIIAEADLPFHARSEHVQIYIDTRRILVRTSGTAAAASYPPVEAANESDAFLLADLDDDVDANTANASLKGEKLTVMVRKRSPDTVGPIQFSSAH